MKVMQVFGALLCAAVFASAAHAQFSPGVANWAYAYPTTGTTTGTILVKGTTTFGLFWKPTGEGSIKAVDYDGTVTTWPITVNADGTWGESAIPGLTSGTVYTVTVTIVVEWTGCGAPCYPPYIVTLESTAIAK
jgi:hypothetical protein